MLLPTPQLIQLTYAIYLLHLVSAVSGLLSAPLIVTAFLTGWPSILAVVLNYMKRSAVEGTYLESHFYWQIRTFWLALFYCVIAGVLFITVIGIPIAFVMAMLVGVWVLYRLLRGLRRLSNAQAMTI